MTLRVAALTPGPTVPSTRFRVLQHVEPLARRGIAVTPLDARFGAYPPPARTARPFWLAATAAERLVAALRSRRFDATLLQRELVSTLATFERLTGRPRVLDVDDAIWLYRGGWAARAIGRACDGIVCGNSFLAEWFGRLGPPVDVVPTAVDTARFRPLERIPPGPRVIGWSGTSSGFRYLHDIEDTLRDVLLERPEARLRIVSDRPPSFTRLPAERVDYFRWSPRSEVERVQTMSVGIMPLRDTDWERGKCSYKMLLYMACGVPVVVSPVGMNRDVLAQGDVGVGARTPAEWRDALLAMIDDPGDAGRRGAAGRAVVERHYAVERVADRLAGILRRVAGPAPSRGEGNDADD